MVVRALWVVAALMACVGAVLILTPNDAGPGPTLIAKQLIPAGTPGNLVDDMGMFNVANVPREPGAVSDPSYLAGRTASRDIFPGEQLTASDFSR